jgi:hypothetical protein
VHKKFKTTNDRSQISFGQTSDLRNDVRTLARGIRRRRHILDAPSVELSKASKASVINSLETVVFGLEDRVATGMKKVTRRNIVSYLSPKPMIIAKFAVRIKVISGWNGRFEPNCSEPSGWQTNESFNSSNA